MATLPSKTYRVYDARGCRTIACWGNLSFSRVVENDTPVYRYMGLIDCQDADPDDAGGGVVYLRLTKEQLVLHYWFHPADGSPAIEQVSW
jgi:hypothetical protein